MTTIDVNNIQTFSNADLAKLFRRAAVDAAFAQSVTISGKTLSRTSPTELMRLASIYEGAAARETTGGFFAAQFRNPE